MALCCLGYLPGLLHAWYIIAKYPEIDREPPQQDSSFSPISPLPQPPPPPPPLPPYKPRGISNRPTIQKQPTPPKIGIGIGIETEFLLQSREPNSEDVSLFRFARRCAIQYNEQVDQQHPRMHSLVQALWQGQPHTQWCLHYDPTCETRSAPWGIELISPLFRIYPGSEWRQHIRATWRFLNENYMVTGNNNCSTHVHISQAEGYSLEDLKRVAQAVIYFEPAFEALLPASRRGNEYARSNWIDNPALAYQNLSRAQSLNRIENLTTVDELIDLMNPNQSKYFGWNFLSIKTYQTIEFRRGAVSTSVTDVFMWVELATSFVQASLTAPTSVANLLQYPATVGGLRTFIGKAQLGQPEMYNPSSLNQLFAAKDLNSRLDPNPVGQLSEEKQLKLEKKIIADSMSNPVLDMIASAQAVGTI